MGINIFIENVELNCFREARRKKSFQEITKEKHWARAIPQQSFCSSFMVGWLASAIIQAWLLSISCAKLSETCSKVDRLGGYVTFLFFYKKSLKFLHCEGLLLAYPSTFSFSQISRKFIGKFMKFQKQYKIISY